MTPIAVAIDPVTLEIVRHALLAGSEEMMINLKRTAYGAHIYEVEDCVGGLFDRDGNALALAPGSPMMLCDLGAVIRDGLEKLGRAKMEPGDIIANNDPYTLGGHSSNMTLYSPIFWEGRIVAFTATRAHWIDTAGAVPGGKSFDIHEIWQEGFQFRHIKLFRRGEAVEDWMQFLKDNGRLPETTLGDMRAQVAAARTGERRMMTLLEKFGLATIEAAATEMFRQGEELARQGVAAMKDGTYTAEAFLDNDGVVLDKRVPIKVTVRIEGTDFEVDYSEISDQVIGPINTGVAAARGIAAFAFKALTTPHEAPNEGHFRPLKIKIPPGKILSARSPAATAWWSKCTNTTIDTILAAIEPAIPHDVPAPHFGDVPLIMTAGKDPRRNNKPFIYFQPIPGGYGARSYEDGESCTNCLHEGAMQNIPVEVEEHQFPVHTEYATYRVDSEGPGRYRGGFGYEAAYRILVDGELFVGVERSQCAPWGIAGGGAAKANDFVVRRSADDPGTSMLKAQWVKVNASTVCTVLTGGGGGYGDPLERELADVAEDARLGYITVEHAKTAYGVVLDPATFAVDEAASGALRRR
ncbi:MAG: hydantoinase B/oxoprolinase family protein [Chloroflexota bacterium]|nr:hydantoinase B/oxoprolinase family protein [Chloroflexota bacterium]